MEQFLEGGVGSSQDHFCLSEELRLPLQGDIAISEWGMVGYWVAMVDVGLQVVW